MRIEPDTFRETLIVDVQTRRDGTGAMKIAWDADTEVVYGPLYARVTLHDLKVQVVMDPDPGRWKELKWARAKAMEALCRPDVAPLFIVALARLQFDLGVRAGENKLRHDMRNLLGVDDVSTLAHAYGDE